MAAIARKFFADRGTHLAAMIAYFALLSFVPLLYLSLALLGTAHEPSTGSFFVRELHRSLPGTSLDAILEATRRIRDNATALGVIGAGFLLWSSLSLFSVLESAFNIVYDRANRGFLRGKVRATVMMAFSLTALFVSLVVGTVGVDLARRYFGLRSNVVLAYVFTVGVSLLGVFVFVASAYVVLTNEALTLREVLPGAVAAAVVAEATFQLLPAFVSLSKRNPVLQTLSGPAVLLVWLYVLANIIVLGAEVNWHLRDRRGAPG
jgi:YihY family inner membrane protein